MPKLMLQQAIGVTVREEKSKIQSFKCMHKISNHKHTIRRPVSNVDVIGALLVIIEELHVRAGRRSRGDVGNTHIFIIASSSTKNGHATRLKRFVTVLSRAHVAVGARVVV
jgi:hypothetical protein